MVARWSSEAKWAVQRKGLQDLHLGVTEPAAGAVRAWRAGRLGAEPRSGCGRKASLRQPSGSRSSVHQPGCRLHLSVPTSSCSMEADPLGPPVSPESGVAVSIVTSVLR